MPSTPSAVDIRTQNVYRFKIKPLQPSGGKYWGADNLTQVFYVSDKNAAAIELRFNFPTATLQASSLDEQGKVVSTQTFALLAESATPPSGSDTKYLYLTKSGELLSKWQNCTPDMSVGCSWGDIKYLSPTAPIWQCSMQPVARV